MPKSPVEIEASTWLDAAERFGVVNAILLMLAFGVMAGIAFRGPEWIKALNGTLDIILKYMKDRKRVAAQVRKRQADTSLVLENKKRKYKPKVKGPKS